MFLINIVRRFELLGDDPLFADWVSGAFSIPIGKALSWSYNPVHESVYSKSEHIFVADMFRILNLYYIFLVEAGLHRKYSRLKKCLIDIVHI